MKQTSFFEKLAYGSGASAECVMANLVIVLALPIYNIALGIDAKWVGLAVALPKMWDAFFDPFMGNISDNTSSRWGRRKIFIFWGALVTGILCFFMWAPPTILKGWPLLIYFTMISMFYYTAYAVFFVPYNALGFEMSSDYDERTQIMCYKTFFLNFAGCAFTPWAYKLCFLPCFGGNEVKGVRIVGLIYGLIIISFGIMPALFCRERHVGQAKISFINAIRITFTNKAFLILCGIIFSILAAYFIAWPLLTYLNIAYITNGSKEAAATFLGLVTTAYGLAGFLSVPLINWLGVKWGKQKTLMAGVSLVMVAFMFSWFYITPKMPYLQIIFGIIASPGMACVWVFTYAMTADICDLDELNTGLRREGLYGAVYAWLMKTGAAGSIFLSGLLLDLCGFNREVLQQTAATTLKIRAVYAFGPLALMATALYLIYKFPLTKKRVEEIQASLRREKVTVS
jgi:glycoside/pentoside/hexuronide:cation symporter, GPH family